MAIQTSKVKFASLTEPTMTIDEIIELASNMEICFQNEKGNR